MSYGCYNRNEFALVQILHGIDSQTGERIKITIPNQMSKTCQYQKTDLYNDPECIGCKHKEVKQDGNR